MMAQFGTAAQRVLHGAQSGTIETGSTGPSTDSLDLRTLPARLDDQMLARVQAIANAPLPVYGSCSREHFLVCMKYLALLPRKSEDDTKAKVRLTAYWRKLGHYSEQAWSHLTDTALDRFDWFPTPKQCREVLDLWTQPRLDAGRKALAQRLCLDEWTARRQELGERIRRGELTEEQIEALPDQVKAQLETACVLLARRDPETGRLRYSVRPSALEPARC